LIPRKETENTRVVKAAWVVGLATLLSRIFGFIRDMVVAGFFGAGLSADAFFVAFRIPNLLRSLFAEGSLTIAYRIPQKIEVSSRRICGDSLYASLNYSCSGLPRGHIAGTMDRKDYCAGVRRYSR